MSIDPRHRNQILDTSSIAAYKSSYAMRLQEAIATVDDDQLEQAVAALWKAARAGRRIYVAGNGGSAAIADHLCCDWTKGTRVEGHPVLKCTSFTSNVALYSALANDFGFDVALSTQVEYFGEAGDVLVAISSSGNSSNIINAVEAAAARGLYVVGLSGFEGGKLAGASDASLWVKAHNYGIVEDAHQALMHVIAQYIANLRDSGGAPAYFLRYDATEGS